MNGSSWGLKHRGLRTGSGQVWGFGGAGGPDEAIYRQGFVGRRRGDAGRASTSWRPTATGAQGSGSGAACDGTATEDPSPTRQPSQCHLHMTVYPTSKPCDTSNMAQRRTTFPAMMDGCSAEPWHCRTRKPGPARARTAPISCARPCSRVSRSQPHSRRLVRRNACFQLNTNTNLLPSAPPSWLLPSNS